jgi:hypothetical protein
VRDAKVSERAEAVMAGRSGVAVMDEFARELVETGYLHNHARMWWASFWIHVEGLPWELGADFFYRHLLDADAASNTLSWRWVAGLQTPGKTYLVRRSNVEKYLEVIADETGLEQLEDGRVKARFISETADLTVREWRECASSVEELRARVGVWIHEDDLSVECSAELKGCKPVAATAFLAAARVLSEKREAHLERALQDACARATMQWGVQVGLERGKALVRHLVDWVQRERVDVMVAMRPFVGPLGDEIETIEAELGKVGIRNVWLRRASDEQVLPLARRGFFPFWEKLSRELRSKSDLMRKEEHE